MNQRRANVTVNVFAEKSAIYVLDDNNETKVSVSLDVSPIKVFVGDASGDFVTYAEVIKLLNESDGVTTVHNAQRLGGYPADHYPRKAENALITGAWRHTGPLALGGNFLAAAALHNEGETILGGNTFLGGDVVSRGGAQSGFSGYGLWYREEDNHLMIDNLTVRKAMRVYELIVNQIRGTNGSLWVSDTVKIVSAEETATTWRCFIDTNDASSIVPFREGDLIRSQKWTGKGVKYYSSKVVATATEFFELDKETWDGWDIPEAEDVLVRFGNVDDPDRQGALYLTSSDTDAPYMDVLDGVDSFSLAGKTKVRLGRLNGIFYNTEQLSGYGLYADRALLTGAIRNLNGQWALNEDGSGILAGGAIEWTASGELTIGSRNPAEYALSEDVEQFIQETDSNFTALDEDQQALYLDLQSQGQQIVTLNGNVSAVIDETGRLSDEFGIMDGKIIELGDIVSGHAASIQTLNGSIPHINNTIAGIENDIEGINSQVAAALGGVSQLNTDFSGMSGDIEAIEEFNEGLFNTINELASRKNTRFISATEPVLPEGKEFSIGDEWLQEIEVPSEDGTGIEYEYKSWMWFGNSWQPNETKINGARIETGTIDAASIITESLFSKKIGGVELNVVSGNIGGFTIDDRLVAENDAGQGLIIDPATRSILLNDMVEGYGVSRIAMTAKGLTPEATINNGGGLGFSATVDSDEYNIRMPGGALINSNNTRVGVSFVQYIGKSASNQAQIRSAVPTQSSGFPVDLNTSYTFDLPYSFRIYHDGGDRNGRKNKLHGNLQVSVTASLMGVNSSGISKALIDPISVQTLITRSTNDTEVFMRPITFKTSFYSDNSVAVYWKLDIDLDGDLTYQQWTSQLFGHYWMTSESRGIDYRGCVPKGLSMDASVGLLELTTSGLQFAWSQDRFFRIDGPNEDYFVKSTGKWVHDGTFQLNSSDIVTIDNVSSAIASDLSAYAMKSYVNDGFYDKVTADGRFAKKAGDGAQDFNVKDLIIHGQVNHWFAQQLVVEDSRIQVNRRQDGATVDSGLVIYNKDTSAEVSSLVYDVNGIWKAGGSRLFTEAYNPKLGGYVAGDYPRKAEAAVISEMWRFDSSVQTKRVSFLHPTMTGAIRGDIRYREWDGVGSGFGIVLSSDGIGAGYKNMIFAGFEKTYIQGNVGIDVPNPAEKLHVAGNARVDGRLVSRVTAVSNSMTLGSDANTGFNILNDSGIYGLFFGIAASGRSWIQGGRRDGSSTVYDIMLQPNGANVGIGLAANSTPTERLHVAGNGRFTGNLTAVNAALSGTLGVAGNVTAGAQLSVAQAATFGGSAGTGNFVSQMQGWRVTPQGQADFRHIFTDELQAKAFTADISQALVGSDVLTKSVAKLAQNWPTTPDGATSAIYVEELEGFPGFQVFAVGDRLLLRLFDRSGGGLLIKNIWATVASYVSTTNNVQRYTITVNSGGAVGHTVYAGSMILDYGTSGSGVIERTVLDQQGSPYSRVSTWVTSPDNPENYTLHYQSGNLNGISNASGWGVYSENSFLTGKLLVGDLTKAGQYMEYENGELTIKGQITVTGGNAATKADVDAVQVGGRNLLRNTNKGTTNWAIDAQSGTGTWTTSASLDGGIDTVLFTKTVHTASGWAVPKITAISPSKLSADADYVVSFYAKSNFEASGTVKLSTHTNTSLANSPSVNIPSSESWVKITAKITTLPNYDALVFNQGTIVIRMPATGATAAGNYIQFKDVKLELGNRATDWTPAPEDVDAGIAAAQSAASTLKDRVEDRLGLAQLENIDQTLITGNKIRTSLLEVTDIVAQGITAGHVEGLTLNFTKGKIGDFEIFKNPAVSSLSIGTANMRTTPYASTAEGMALYTQGTDKRIVVKVAGTNYVDMRQGPYGWGLYGVKDGATVFQLGGTNRIAGINFDDSRLYTSNWELNKDGSFYFGAGGEIEGSLITGVIESQNWDGTVGSRLDLHNGHLIFGDAVWISGDASEIHVRDRDTGLDSFRIGDFPLTPTNFAGAGVDVLLSSHSVTASPAIGSYQLNRTVYAHSSGQLSTSVAYISNSLIVGGTYNFHTKLKVVFSREVDMETLPVQFGTEPWFARRGGNGIKMQLKNDNTVVWEQNITAIPENGVVPLLISTSFQATSYSLQLIVTIDGEYEYRDPYDGQTIIYNTRASIGRLDSSSRLVLQALLGRMELSTKGMQAVFSSSNYFRCDSNAIEGRGTQTFISPNGQYRLRVSNDGIEKSTNYGGSWTPL